jgi:hypothetical protein
MTAGLIVSPAAWGGDTPACAAVVACTGDIHIDSADALAKLQSCGSVEGVLRFEGQDWLERPRLPCLTSVGHLYFSDNPRLASLEGLGGLTTVGGDLWLTNNVALTSLEGLHGLTSVGEAFNDGSGLLNIVGNTVLTSTEGLQSIPSLENLYIVNNPVLTSLEGLRGLTAVRTTVNIGENVAVTTLSGLRGVTSVGTLYIQRMDALTTLDGLQAITAIKGDVVVAYNLGLTSLAGLAGLQTAPRSLWIGSNGQKLPEISDIAGLTNHLAKPE